MSVALSTSTVVQGMLESATLFAQQAKDAGVNITLDQKPPDSYWSDAYLKTSFFQTEGWPVRSKPGRSRRSSRVVSGTRPVGTIQPSRRRS